MQVAHRIRYLAISNVDGVQLSFGMNALTNLLDLLGTGPDDVKAFAARTPLAACDEDGMRLAVIFAAHPQLPNAEPEPDGPTAYTLKIAQPFSESMFCLPANVEYRAVRFTTDVPCLTIAIDTADGTVTTNIQELSRALSPWSVTTEAAKESAFAALSNAFERPAPLAKRFPFVSRFLGQITPEGLYTEWNASPIAVPYFDNRLIPVSLGATGLPAAIVPNDAAEIDNMLEAFLSMGPSERERAGKHVLALCHDFLQAVGADTDDARAMLAITDPADIWAHVSGETIHIYKETRYGDAPLYIMLLCGCDWEEEHGLQLVYRNGNELVRVSEQDMNVGPFTL
jgi:hypothetical protein